MSTIKNPWDLAYEEFKDVYSRAYHPEKEVLKKALAEYIKWFGKREVKTDKLIEVSKQSRDVSLAMLLQEELINKK